MKDSRRYSGALPIIALVEKEQRRRSQSLSVFFTYLPLVSTTKCGQRGCPDPSFWASWQGRLW